ncbi:ATP-dependent DNA ligase [Sphingomonas sp. BIUV-7]|uniref:DNA ligase (ATP) n=1 Tax=Sphingomonas natans TaxID=3063330 RepID=A0ABT8Y499_9SPHN|nr:ATP-dependent DNA ligase [Sphingomonas sp. BIUV-7]MDO6413133.1 ATP-dependent DNA ligase [Sphingomonas sp. BIUV-7]
MTSLTFPADDAPGIAPMEAKLVDALPTGPDWQYEPKWDGFRCIAWRDGDRIALRSRSDKPLGRYFPEILAMLATIEESRFVLDGELVVPVGDALSFSALQARLHPAASRVTRLSAETPAQFVTFDCLAVGESDLIERPFAERRAALEAFHADIAIPDLHLSPRTRSEAVARDWLAQAGGALDGIVAKRLDLPYRPGERVMAKLKQHRTADCVVGGFRYASGEARAIGSLLLGLYNDEGQLDHVGFTSGIDAEAKIALLATLEPLIEAPGFTGDAPGGPSRWATARSAEWQPLRTELVVEVRYDQVSDDRFRHGTTLLRWRPDKAPADCKMAQLARELRPDELEALLAASHGPNPV